MNAITMISEMQYKAERVMLAISFAVLLTLSGLYMYLLCNSVVHVVMSREAENSIHETHSEIADLEAQYMEMQNKLSREVVEQKGYIIASKKVFIDRSVSTLVTQR